MSKLTTWAALLTAISLAAIAAGYTARAQASGARAQTQASSAKQVRVAFSQGLPPLDGSHLKATLVEVTYGPGASSAPHSHPVPRDRLRGEGNAAGESEGRAGSGLSRGRKFLRSAERRARNFRQRQPDGTSQICRLLRLRP